MEKFVFPEWLVNVFWQTLWLLADCRGCLCFPLKTATLVKHENGEHLPSKSKVSSGTILLWLPAELF